MIIQFEAHMDRASNTLKNKSGFAALIIVMVLGAVSLLIAVTSSFLGMGEAGMSFVADKGSETLAVADGCMEDTLERLRRDAEYSGTQAPTVSGGTCIITVTTPPGDPTARTIAVEGILGDGEYHKKIEASIAIASSPGGNSISMNYWKELSN